MNQEAARRSVSLLQGLAFWVNNHACYVHFLMPYPLYAKYGGTESHSVGVRHGGLSVARQVAQGPPHHSPRSRCAIFRIRYADSDQLRRYDDLDGGRLLRQPC